jgi:hypothetical protein
VRSAHGERQLASHGRPAYPVHPAHSAARQVRAVSELVTGLHELDPRLMSVWHRALLADVKSACSGIIVSVTSKHLSKPDRISGTEANAAVHGGSAGYACEQGDFSLQGCSAQS